MTSRPLSIVALSLLLLPGCASHAPGIPPGFYEASTRKPYADVMAELELAITEHNFRITGHNHIGSVIRERDNIAFPDYDTLQFCNLTYARQMLEISPAAVAYMPCNISVRQQGELVYVTTHLLPTDTPDARLNAFFTRMNGELKKIVDFAAEQ
ncbi:DUF302 domain-containing protein [Methylococcus sp. EFPC2]|uniref:DUF302 domain-containing protein n=1 Tax=Methylococcus sp. EFPC2 TaxID=2812648 RepID=UPI00196767DC|nr:DUF302 domain-containing protein [Methylococcus sp. EFPC2]QSA97442.1 DUF302 domain-containing protein [Methylococcus sp. EFPC2]